MKKLISLLMLIVLIGLASQAQFIKNGDMVSDTNSNNLADHWQVGEDTDPMLEQGWQFVQSNYFSELYQFIDLPNPAGRTFRLQFDIESNDWTQCMILIDENYGYVCSAPNPQPIGGPYHYDLIFVYTQNTIKGIKFRTVSGNSWMKIDNVSMVEIFPVGIEKHRKLQVQNGFIIDMAGRKLSHPPNKGIYIMNGIKYVK